MPRRDRRWRRFGAENVVLAAGAFSGKIEGVAPPVSVRPIRGQMVALRSSETACIMCLRSERGYIVPRTVAPPQHVVTGSTLEDAALKSG